MKETQERKPYEKPDVVLERDLEALASDCGEGPDNVFLGGYSCKGLGECIVAFS